jgi:nucleoside-diphosphate-sugar epimerase
LKKTSKIKVGITGGSGLLGSHFYQKFKKKFKIFRYPYRIENFKKMNSWIIKNQFHYFIHFAAITKNESNKFYKSLKLINVDSSINILDSLNSNNDNIKMFLFISSSHVYGYSNKSIKENKIRRPMNVYGKSKKTVEDHILKNKKKYNFKIGIARVFNTTGKRQKKGNFVPDMLTKIKNSNYINNINQYRDFIHIDDVSKSLYLILDKHFTKPINISSGKKINLIKICKLLNKFTVNKKLYFDSERGENIFGNNKLLRKLGLKNFKNIRKIVKSYTSAK